MLVREGVFCGIGVLGGAALLAVAKFFKKEEHPAVKVDISDKRSIGWYKKLKATTDERGVGDVEEERGVFSSTLNEEKERAFNDAYETLKYLLWLDKDSRDSKVIKLGLARLLHMRIRIAYDEDPDIYDEFKDALRLFPILVDHTMRDEPNDVQTALNRASHRLRRMIQHGSKKVILNRSLRYH